MAVPKKKQSHKRTYMRKRTKKKKLEKPVYDKKTGRPRLSHRTLEK